MQDASRQYDLPPDGLDPWEIPAIEVAVRVFIARNHSVPGHEEEDLVDECVAAWLDARRTYNPQRSAPRTFLNQVVRNHLIDLLRSATAQQRGRDYETLSLDTPLDPEDVESGTLHDVIDGTLADSDPERATEHRLLAEAVARIRARLSPVEQESLDDFLAELSPTAIERLRGTARTTAASRRTQVLRKLRSSGLHQFLD